MPGWEPILDGALALAARAAVDDIAAGLADARPTAAGIADGDAGLALFYSHRATAFEDAEAAGRAIECCLRAYESMTPLAGIGLLSGLSGIAWTLDHVADVEGDDPAAAVDGALAELLARDAWPGPFDLVSGLAGLGVYLLDRRSHERARAAVEDLLRHLETLATTDDAGTRWLTRAELLAPARRAIAPHGHYDVGLAHGTPGVIALLGRACAAGIGGATARSLLSGAVSWLLAQQLRDEDARYPTWIAPGSDFAGPARSAWCYGDPGVAAALWIAAQGAGEPAWEHKAHELARLAAARPAARTGVINPGLCHGAFGLAHLFNRFYQASGDAIFADAARDWIERGLRMRRPGQEVAGFARYDPDAADADAQWVADPGLLTGAAGIGLALIAALAPLEPTWDRLLLCDVARRSEVDAPP